MNSSRICIIQCKYFLFIVSIGTCFILSACASNSIKNLNEMREQQIVRQQEIDSQNFSELQKLPEMTAQEHEILGDSLLSQGQLAMAYIHYEKAQMLNPKKVSINYKKGLALLMADKNQDAIEAFQKMLKDQPNHSLSLEGIGQAYFQLKDYENASKYFNEALRIDSTLWRSHNYLGNIYDIQKKYELAIKEYSKAIFINPKDGRLYNNLGISYLLSGQHERAIGSFVKSIETGYQNPKVYNNLGLSLSKAGKYREAFESFQKGGNLAIAYNNIGCVYMAEGKYQDAIECFEKAIELNPGYYAKAGENLKRARLNAKHNR